MALFIGFCIGTMFTSAVVVATIAIAEWRKPPAAQWEFEIPDGVLTVDGSLTEEEAARVALRFMELRSAGSDQ